MTVTVIMKKNPKSGIWSAFVKGNGPERGNNLLTGKSATSRYDDAQGNVRNRLKIELNGIAPTVVFQIEQTEEQQ